MSTFEELDWEGLRVAALESKEKHERDADEFWDNLAYEDQLRAFYAVSKRIYRGEIIEQGSYRYVLYDVFKFGPEAYALGMDCGYMYLHNSIVDAERELNKPTC